MARKKIAQKEADEARIEEDGIVSFVTNDTPDAYQTLLKYLEAAQQECSTSLEHLDTLLTTIHSMKQSYYDVTGRTNNLMAKCESLLEEQHNLQNTVEILNKTLKPFQDIEDVANILGIPIESIHHNSSSSSSGLTSPTPAHHQSAAAVNLDPRSPEFKEVLMKLSSAVVFLHEHKEIMENHKYSQWLEKLQVRAISLIGRSMRELIDKTAKQCREIIQQKLYYYPGASSSASSQHSSASLGGSSSSSAEGNGASRLYSDEQPLESLPIYQKFRGLSYRMKELVTILLKGNLMQSVNSANDQQNNNNNNESSPRAGRTAVTHKSLFNHLLKHDYAILAEVKKSYALIRMELLQPFLQEAFVVSLAVANKAIPHTPTSSSSLHPSHSGTNFSHLIDEKRSSLHNNNNQTASSASSSTSTSSAHHLSLSTVIRHSFSTLLRIAQLEYQLFDSLFNIDGPSSSMSGHHLRTLSSESMDLHQSRLSSASTDLVSTNQQQQQQHYANDLIRVIEFLSNSTRDFLRPLIIRESSVDELCRVITALSEDIKSQIMILMIPAILLKQLITGLENILNDSKERLIYCSENRLRLEIQFYEPLPSHLQYPDILERFEEKLKNPPSQAIANNSSSSSSNTTAGPPALLPPSSAVDSVQEMYDTWYPPMRLSLSLLSKLYGIIDMTIFEDFARRCIEICILSLVHGSEQIKRQQKTMLIHGDLFLVRHLLILREQLIPFEIKLVSTEKVLDFTNTRLAWQQLVNSNNNGSNNLPLSIANSPVPPPSTPADPSPASSSDALQQMMITAPHSSSSSSSSISNTNNTTSSSSSGSFLNNLFLRFDENNLLFQFAKSGVPTMKEFRYDMKKELDNSLKKACLTLKLTAVKLLLVPLDNLLAKITAFIGDIPFQYPQSNNSNNNNNNNNNNNSSSTPTNAQASANSEKSTNNNVPVMANEQISLLKNQSFLRFDRIKECLEQVQHLLVQRIPDIRGLMKVSPP